MLEVVAIGEVFERATIMPLGIGIVSAPEEPLMIVFKEAFNPLEWATLQGGNYAAGLRIVSSGRIAGIAWQMCGRDLRVGGYANFSLAAIFAQCGEEREAEIRSTLKTAQDSCDDETGLLVSFILLDPETCRVRAMRAFTLNAPMTQRWFEAVEITDVQTREDNEEVEAFVDDSAHAWESALPGVAVAGMKAPQTAGEWERISRTARGRA